jgi:CBS domain-containing protein
MTTCVLTTSSETKAVDAALVVALHDITALPVMRDGRVVGMFSEEDLLSTTSPTPQAQLTVGDVMRPLPLTTAPDHDWAELARAMAERGVASVPVLDRGQMVGIVTRRDLRRLVPRAG